MAATISLLVIALAVSLDSCSIGLLYGMRRIRVPLLSLLIISFLSGLMIWCSMKLGEWLSGYFEPETARAAGAFILVVIGIWAVIQFFLHTPADGDMDRSGDISAAEAALVGFALSLDALGAGVGAAMVGFAALPAALLIAAASGCFISLGLWLGRWAASIVWVRRMTILPGFLLIIIGLLKLL